LPLLKFQPSYILPHEGKMMTGFQTLTCVEIESQYLVVS